MQDIFDKIAFEYDYMNNIISFWAHKIIKNIVIQNSNLKDNMLVLDLFTGTGDIISEIKKKFPNITAIGADNSRNMLKIARKKHNSICFMKQDAQNMNFKTGIFDRIFSTFGLRNADDKVKSIREIKRVLKKDGYFIHLDFGEKNIFSKIYDRYVLISSKFFAKNKEAYKYLINSKNSYFSPDELRKFFIDEGFEIVLEKNYLFKIINLQIVRKKM